MKRRPFVCQAVLIGAVLRASSAFAADIDIDDPRVRALAHQVAEANGYTAVGGGELMRRQVAELKKRVIECGNGSK